MRAGLRQEVSSQEECSRSPLKLPDAVLQGGLGDPRISLRPVIAAARDQPHPIPVALDTDAEAVMFDFVRPLGAGRNLGCIGRQAELKRLKHARKICIRSCFAKAVSTAPPMGAKARPC